jgi:aspartate aminotransferase
MGLSKRARHIEPSGTQDTVEQMRQEFDRRRKAMGQRLKGMKSLRVKIPQGAFFVYPEVSSWFGKKIGGIEIRGSGDFCSALVGEGGIGLVPGVGFLQEGFVRITYACSMEEIVEDMDRMEKCLGSSQ